MRLPVANCVSRCFRVDGSTLILIAVMFIASACSDTATAPPADPELPSSHEWEWEYTVIDPDNTSGWLWDVCYINDTCIWAVGKIQHHGDWYNACRWNGREWVLEKVYDDPTGSATEPGVHELHTVYGIAPDDIWFVVGNAFIHWNGHRFRTDYSLIRSIQWALGTSWGNGSNNLYVGGHNGDIVHYNGHYWKRLENDIEWDIAAMQGNGDTVLVAATDWEFTGNTAFYTIVGETVQFLMQDKYVRGVDALWFSHLSDIYTDGPRVFHYDGMEWKKTSGAAQLSLGGFGRDMAANSNLDILTCGDFGTIRHFNGEDWRQWKDVPGFEYAQFNGCAMHGDEAWLVGLNTEGYDILIVKGTRMAK